MSLRSTHTLRLLAIGFCVFFISPILFAHTASAAADPITVTSRSDTITFPKSIDYSISISDSSSLITSATIYLKYNSDSFAETHSVSPDTPAQKVTLHWIQDISSDNYLTPGTPVAYYWFIIDKSGNSHTDTTQQFSVIDSRFSWQHVSSATLQVNWYNESTDFGQAVLQQADDAIGKISNVLGGKPSTLMNLWVYATDQDFHGSLPPGTYEWVGGIAMPSLHEAFIVASSLSDDTLVRDMPHELTHLVFHQLISQGIDAPVWFDEGLAVYNQFFHEPEMRQRLNDALTSHSLLRLDDIAFRFPENSDLAYLAYAQSWNLISYMYSTFGQPKMALLINSMNSTTTTFNQDLQTALGMDQLHLENQWRISLHQPGVLSQSQLTPTVQPTPTQLSQPQKSQSQAPLTSDSNEPLYVSIGVVLILGSIVGIVFIIVLQRRQRQDRVMAQQMTITSLSYNPSAQSYYPYINPARYTQHPPAYRPGNPGQLASMTPPGTRSYHVPAEVANNTPDDSYVPDGNVWYSYFSPSRSNEEGEQRGSPGTPNREYPVHTPGKNTQIPQE